MSGSLSILGVLTVLVPLPLLALQVAGAVVLARQLPSGPRRSFGVAAFAVGALASLVWMTGSMTARLAPRIQDELDLPLRHVVLMLGLLGWVGGLVGAAAVLLVVLALLKTSTRSEYRTW